MKLLMSKEMDGKFILLKSIALIPLSRPGCTKKSRPLSGDQ